MRILGISPIQQQNPKCDLMPAKYSTGLKSDTFERTNKSPSFKQNLTVKTSKELLLAISAGLAAAGELIRRYAENGVNADKETKDALETVKNVLGLNLEETKTELPETDTQAETAVEELKPQDDRILFEFPKRSKPGILPKELRELKPLLSGLVLTQEYSDKLSETCKALFEDNKFGLYEEEKIDNKTMAKNLAEEIGKTEDDEAALKKVIDKYHGICVENIVPIKVSVGKPTVIGQLSPEEVAKMEKHKRPRVKKTDSAAAKKSAPEKITAETVGKDSWLVKIPGANNRSLQQNLDILLDFCKDKVEQSTEGNIKWLNGCQVYPNVYTSAIEREIDKYSGGNETKSRRICEPYTRIKIEDAQIIAETINSDRRFHDLFTVHGATRFFERYVDLQGKNILVQTQEKLDALEKLINLAISGEGKGLYASKYCDYDKEGNELVGFRFIINPGDYGPEFVDKLGSFDIKIGISEKRTLANYNSKHKPAIISSIFSKGV